MTVCEALKLCGVVIETLEKSGVRLCDHKYLALFEDFRQAEQRGDKISTIRLHVGQSDTTSCNAIFMR